MSFSYDRINSTPEKRNLNGLSKFSNAIQKRMLSKVLDFVNRI